MSASFLSCTAFFFDDVGVCRGTVAGGVVGLAVVAVVVAEWLSWVGGSREEAVAVSRSIVVVGVEALVDSIVVDISRRQWWWE